MHELEELVEGRYDLSGLIAVDPVGLVRPVHLARLYVPLPAAEVGHALRLTQHLLALTELVLRVLRLVLGDVPRCAHESCYLTATIFKGHLAVVGFRLALFSSPTLGSSLQTRVRPKRRISCSSS